LQFNNRSKINAHYGGEADTQIKAIICNQPCSMIAWHLSLKHAFYWMLIIKAELSVYSIH